MRLPIITLFLIAASLVGRPQMTHAQPPESYPWCGIRFVENGSSRSCYYTSREQCMVTLSGAGGICVESPYYHPQPGSHETRKRSRIHR